MPLRYIARPFWVFYDPLHESGEIPLAREPRRLPAIVAALPAMPPSASLLLLAGGYRAAAVALVDLGRIDEARD